MIRTTLPLHRRTRVERRVLDFIRNRELTLEDPHAVRCFTLLRQLAERRGMMLHPPGTPYISESELTLLSWIANGQRVSEPPLPDDDCRLAIVMSHIAMLLNQMRLRLSPLTLHSVRVRQAR
ncbi:hypothetical protein [Sphingobium lactosutens]|uniref:hypothetical protein n=1 Tax=Sphingobium lactosutens TaxID=522773 RepID=UPI0015BDA4CD|nr:hypothetical protein [Sphingobium lactosutens]